MGEEKHVAAKLHYAVHWTFFKLLLCFTLFMAWQLFSSHDKRRWKLYKARLCFYAAIMFHSAPCFESFNSLLGFAYNWLACSSHWSPLLCYFCRASQGSAPMAVDPSALKRPTSESGSAGGLWWLIVLIVWVVPGTNTRAEWRASR